MKKSLFLLLLSVLPCFGQSKVLFQVYQKPFSFILQGDLHSGGPASSYLRLTNYVTSIDIVLSNKFEWGTVLYISPGDCFDGLRDEVLSDSASIAQMTNQLWRLKTNGISVFTCPGNHDSDLAGNTNLWNDFFTTNFFWSDPMYVTSRTNGDMRDIVFAYTNGNLKFVFVGWRWNDELANNSNDVMRIYQPATYWASNVVTEYSNHLAIGIMHYFLNTIGNPGTGDKPPEDPIQGYENIGPGIEAWLDGFIHWTNAFLALSGHVRQTPQNLRRLYCNDGHEMGAIKWNTQGGFAGLPSNGGAFMVLTFYPTEGYMRARTYDATLGAFMTNGQSSWITHDWTMALPRR